MIAAQATGQRHTPRIRCKIRAVANCAGRTTQATVLNISTDGLSLYLRSDIGIEVGGLVTVETEEIGTLTGKVRWMIPPRVGLEVIPSSNTAAKIGSFLKTIG